MQLSTFFATLAAAAVASAAAIPAADRQIMAARGADYTDGSLTWYAGESLADPACGGATPSDNDLVVAVSADSPFQCNQALHLHYGGAMVPVTVVDQCAGCDSLHVDATKGVFSALSSLDVGELSGVHIVVA